MSVTNYTPENTYRYSKLRNVLYLVDATHVKKVHIDNGVAYIDNLSQAPLKIDGFNISFKEEESLDERYKFQKTVTISVNGYATFEDFGERYYAIVETTDGTRYMVNVDFPSRITHTFNLSDSTFQTDFTFSSQSNYPTLRLDTVISDAQEINCVGYISNGLIGLKLIENNYATISKTSNKLTTYGKSFQTIEYLPKTCSLQEVYDGEKFTDTITFDIAFDNYQTSWHYNLLEFMENLYSAIISLKNTNYKFYSGFELGLQPQVSIDVASTDSGTNSIRITLTEASIRGLIMSNTIEDEESQDKNWRYIKTYDGHNLYECVGQGTARYLVMQEVDVLGNPTGRYKCLNGYKSQFAYLNIIDTFSTTETFYEPSCGGSDCKLTTTVPTTILYDSVTCKTYSISATSAWNITNKPNHITISPISGNANTNYTVSVCNTLTPTATAVEGTFYINYCGNSRIVNTIVQKEEGFLRPSIQNINCYAQTVEFSYDPNCPITITSIDSELTYTIDNGTLLVNVPRNALLLERTWNIVAKDCNNNVQTVHIVQDKTYEDWIATEQYICESGNSYVQEVRYTGATPTTIDNIVYPLETRKGSLIQSGDTRCSKTITEWYWYGNYYCVNGNKIKALEQRMTTDGGLNWTKTGLTKLGETVESASTWCETDPTYEWVLTDKTQCGEDEILNYTFEYCNGQKFMFQDVPSSGGTYNFCLTNLVNSSAGTWAVDEKCDYITISATSSGYTCTVAPNDDPNNDRECFIALRQIGSGNRVTLNTIQKAGSLTCTPLLNYCCGRGSHSDYDIQLGNVSGASTTDSVQGGCTIRMISTLPSWLDVTINSGVVTYRTLEACRTTSRYFTVEFEKVSGSSAYCDTATVLVKQLGGAPPSTNVFHWQDGTVYKDISPSYEGGSQTLALTSTIDGVTTGYSVSHSCGWVTAVTASSSVTVSYAQNDTESSRTCRITFEQYTSHQTMTLVINQSAGSSGETYFRWGDDSHMYEYSATTTYNGNLSLVPFLSKVNGVDTNAVLSSNVSWIQTYNQLYYNYNEVKPNRNETIYLDVNYNEQPRTGLLTLTQKGTSDTIRVYITQAAYVADCSITSFSIDSEVCIGGALNYSFTVADPRCSRTTYFNLYQGETMVRSTATPSGGVGNGVFQTSALSAGTATATCVVNGSQISKYVSVVQCSNPYIDFTFVNQTDNIIDVNRVIILFEDDSTYAWNNLDEEVEEHGSEVRRLWIPLSYKGKTIDVINVSGTEGTSSWSVSAAPYAFVIEQTNAITININY